MPPATSFLNAHRGVPPARRLPRRGLLLGGTLLLGGALMPVLLAALPAMADYPNHLARSYVIAVHGHDPLLARYYGVAWHLFPNLAADVLVPLLAQVVGIYAAGKLFLLLIVAGLATGPLALHHALYRRLSLWPLASVLFIYNGVFGLGLLNYLFATALALWASAVWVWRREGGPLSRGVVSWFFALALFFSHFLGVGLYGMAIGCYELQRWYRDRTTGRRVLRDAAVLLLPFLLIAPLTLLSPTAGYVRETHWQLWPKALGVFFAFLSVSRISAVALAALVLAVGLWGLTSGRLRFHAAGQVFAPLAVLVYAAMPYELASASYADVRLPAAFVLFLLGMSNWEPRGALEARRSAAALVVVAAAELAAVSVFWMHYAEAATRLEESFAKIPRGSRVLLAVNEAGAPQGVRTLFTHLPALVMIARSAFYSNAFSDPAQQPLIVKPPYRATAPHDGEAVPVANLVADDEGIETEIPKAPPVDQTHPPFWSHWRAHYDYLYVMFTPAGYRAPLAGVTPLDRGAIFTLYRIDKRSPG